MEIILSLQKNSDEQEEILEEIKIARPELTDSQAIEVFESMETLCEIMTANHLEHKILPKK